MTGYRDAVKACSLTALKHLISSTGVVKVLHSHVQFNQNSGSKKDEDKEKNLGTNSTSLAMLKFSNCNYGIY